MDEAEWEGVPRLPPSGGRRRGRGARPTRGGARPPPPGRRPPPRNGARRPPLREGPRERGPPPPAGGRARPTRRGGAAPPRRATVPRPAGRTPRPPSGGDPARRGRRRPAVRRGVAGSKEVREDQGGRAGRAPASPRRERAPARSPDTRGAVARRGAAAPGARSRPPADRGLEVPGVPAPPLLRGDAPPPPTRRARAPARTPEERRHGPDGPARGRATRAPPGARAPPWLAPVLALVGRRVLIAARRERCPGEIPTTTPGRPAPVGHGGRRREEENESRIGGRGEERNGERGRGNPVS